MSERMASCSCGELRVHCSGEPLRVSMCHCLACQKRTGSVFGVQSRWLRTQVRMEGEARAYDRVGDSGGTITFHFCPQCGATVYYCPHGMEEFWVVPVGNFADPKFPPPTVAVYEDRRHAWTQQPDAVLQEHFD